MCTTNTPKHSRLVWAIKMEWTKRNVLLSVQNSVRSRINQNPVRKQKNHGSGNGIAPKTMSPITNMTWDFQTTNRTMSYCCIKKIRKRKKSRRLLLYGKENYKETLFTDEKFFTVEETFNKQNDRVYARSSKEARKLVPRIEWGHYPALVMVWWDSVTLNFCEKRVKTAVRIYQWDILTNVVEPLNQTMFQNRPWIFQQDSASAHKAKTIQQWLENHVPKFISSDHWPSIY